MADNNYLEMDQNQLDQAFRDMLDSYIHGDSNLEQVKLKLDNIQSAGMVSQTALIGATISALEMQSPQLTEYFLDFTNIQITESPDNSEALGVDDLVRASITSGNTDIFNTVMDRYGDIADLGYQDEYGLSAAHLAAQSLDVDLLNAVKDAGYDLYALDDRGRDIGHIISNVVKYSELLDPESLTDILSYLEAEGFDLERLDNDGNSVRSTLESIQRSEITEAVDHHFAQKVEVRETVGEDADHLEERITALREQTGIDWKYSPQLDGIYADTTVSHDHFKLSSVFFDQGIDTYAGNDLFVSGENTVVLMRSDFMEMPQQRFEDMLHNIEQDVHDAKITAAVKVGDDHIVPQSEPVLIRQ